MTTRNLPDNSDAARHGTGDADLTIMLAAHAAFRRDLAQLARAAGFADLPDPGRRASVQAGWEAVQAATAPAPHRRGRNRLAGPARAAAPQRPRAVRARRDGGRASADRPAAGRRRRRLRPRRGRAPGRRARDRRRRRRPRHDADRSSDPRGARRPAAHRSGAHRAPNGAGWDSGSSARTDCRRAARCSPGWPTAPTRTRPPPRSARSRRPRGWPTARSGGRATTEPRAGDAHPHREVTARPGSGSPCPAR